MLFVQVCIDSDVLSPVSAELSCQYVHTFFSAGNADSIRLSHRSFEMLEHYICAVQPYKKRYTGSTVKIDFQSPICPNCFVNQQASLQYVRLCDKAQ